MAHPNPGRLRLLSNYSSVNADAVREVVAVLEGRRKGIRRDKCQSLGANFSVNNVFK